MSLDQGSFLARLKCAGTKTRMATLLFTEAIAFVVSLAIVLSIVQTVVPAKEPISYTGGSIDLLRYTKSKPDSHADLELIYHRNVIVNQSSHVTINRYIENVKTNQVFAMGETTVSYDEEGPRTVSRAYKFDRVPPGDWCLKAVERWRPWLSMREHKIKAPDICFTLKAE
jgi:hypothetical protein